jgi:hypothetical protein
VSYTASSVARFSLDTLAWVMSLPTDRLATIDEYGEDFVTDADGTDAFVAALNLPTLTECLSVRKSQISEMRCQCYYYYYY